MMSFGLTTFRSYALSFTLPSIFLYSICYTSCLEILLNDTTLKAVPHLQLHQISCVENARHTFSMVCSKFELVAVVLLWHALNYLSLAKCQPEFATFTARQLQQRTEHDPETESHCSTMVHPCREIYMYL